MASTTYEKQLKSISWRDINFPYGNISTTIENQLVLHEYPDRDGAHVETTGRRPIEVSCTAFFYNHIFPGVGETWTPGNLFPTLYNDFIKACMDGTPGIFSHPTLGTFTAKCRITKTTIDASVRGGAKVDVSWVETIDISGTNLVTPPSEAATTESLVELANVIINVPLKDPRKVGLLQFLDSITGAINVIKLGVARILANIDRALYHINNLLDAIDTFDDNIMALIKRSANNLKSSVIRLRSSSESLIVKLYKVPGPTTVSQLAQDLRVSINALCQANPHLTRNPVVQIGTPIVVPTK